MNPRFPSLNNIGVYLIVSLALAGCLVLFVEKPSDMLRYALRSSKNLRPGLKPTSPAGVQTEAYEPN